MAAVNDHLVGEVLDGRFEILEYIGGGGQASVYKAKDRHVDRIVAIKIMRLDNGDLEEFASRLDAEARSIAKLSDPHVVSVYDQGADRDHRYIVMEYVEGTTLKAVMAKQGAMPVDRALPILEAIVSGLAAAHRLGIIHRDMKPENVLISNRGMVKVADFGLASQLDVATMTVGTTIMASITYASPERLQHTAPVDFRSDIYSVGILAFELLTGRKAFAGDWGAIMSAHQTNDMPAPSTIVGRSIPTWLDVLVATCGRRNADDRPADAVDLLDRLRAGMNARHEGHEDDPALIAAMAAPSSQPSAPIPHAIPIVAPKENTSQLAAPDDTAEIQTDRPADRVPRQSVSLPNFKARRIFVALLAAIVLVASCTGLWWLSSGRFTTVPDLVRCTVKDAQTLIDNAHLVLATTTDYSETVPAGLIISTDPPSTQRVKRGSTVNAVVSQGPERYAVPKVVGLSLADAQAALIAAHLTTGQVTQKYSDTVPNGQVITASISADTMVKPGTPVDLVVSKGPSPITVPDYTGKLAADAMEALTNLGFQPTEVLDNSTDVAEGYVISQDPPGGTTAYKGDAITLTVSQGPRMVTIPTGLVGMNVDDAVAALKALGLVPKINPLGVGPQRKDIVVSTNPPSGTVVTQGSIVVLNTR